MGGPVPHALLERAAALRTLPRNDRRLASMPCPIAATGAPGTHPEADYLCRLTFFRNDEDACVATLSACDVPLLAATHPAAILAAMYLTNSAATIRTRRGSGHFDPSWDGHDFEAAVARHHDGQLEEAPFVALASDDEEHDWLQLMWLFSHDNYDAPSVDLDEFLRSSQHYLKVLGFDHLIRRPVTTPNPRGWSGRLRRRNRYTYWPDL